MTLERELKLRPDAPDLLVRLEAVERLGPFVVATRSRERQRNTVFDTADRALGRAGLAFRRRIIEGQTLATWTLKARGVTAEGISARPEVEVHLAADTSPLLALSALRDAARERGSALLHEHVADALSAGPPRMAPLLEFETDRRLLRLVAAEQGWRAEMALDEVRMATHPAYQEWEIEVELKRGDDDALRAARAAIEQLTDGRVQNADGTKLSRALAHVDALARVGGFDTP